jgi:hypothetical protein
MAQRDLKTAQKSKTNKFPMRIIGYVKPINGRRGAVSGCKKGLA